MTEQRTFIYGCSERRVELACDRSLANRRNLSHDIAARPVLLLVKNPRLVGQRSPAAVRKRAFARREHGITGDSKAIRVWWAGFSGDRRVPVPAASRRPSSITIAGSFWLGADASSPMGVKSSRRPRFRWRSRLLQISLRDVPWRAIPTASPTPHRR
jgi:hypothetical protein